MFLVFDYVVPIFKDLTVIATNLEYKIEVRAAVSFIVFFLLERSTCVYMCVWISTLDSEV